MEAFISVYLVVTLSIFTVGTIISIVYASDKFDPIANFAKGFVIVILGALLWPLLVTLIAPAILMYGIYQWYLEYKRSKR